MKLSKHASKKEVELTAKIAALKAEIAALKERSLDGHLEERSASAYAAEQVARAERAEGETELAHASASIARETARRLDAALQLVSGKRGALQALLEVRQSVDSAISFIKREARKK